MSLTLSQIPKAVRETIEVTDGSSSEKRRWIDWPFVGACTAVLAVLYCFHGTLLLLRRQPFTQSLYLLRHRLGKFTAGKLPALEFPYHDWSIVVAAVRQLPFALLLFVPIIPCVLFASRCSWRRLPGGNHLRWLVGLLCVAFAWPEITYQYNYFLDQSHHFDRLLILLLLCAVWVHPLFVYPLIVVASLVHSQFAYPLGGLSTTDSRALIDALALFVAFLYVALLCQHRWLARTPFASRLQTVFPFLLLCAVASNYLVPAVGEILISPHGYEWALCEELCCHTAFCLNRGWLGFIPGLSTQAVLNTVATWGRPLVILTLIVELVPVLILCRRKLTIMILISLIGLHVGIFALSGIFFWKWIIVNGLVAIFVWKMSPEDQELLFRGRFLESLAVICLCVLIIHPVQLAWFNTRLQNHFEVQVVGESGEVYTLDKKDLVPYDMFFSFERYHFLVDRNLLLTNIGTRDYDLCCEMRNAGPEGALELAAQKGRNFYNESQSEQFDEFIRSYVRNAGRKRDVLLWNRLPGAPLHIYSVSAPTRIRDIDEPVYEVRIWFNREYVTAEGRVVTLSRDMVRRVPIESQDKLARGETVGNSSNPE